MKFRCSEHAGGIALEIIGQLENTITHFFIDSTLYRFVSYLLFELILKYMIDNITVSYQTVTFLVVVPSLVLNV